MMILVFVQSMSSIVYPCSPLQTTSPAHKFFLSLSLITVHLSAISVYKDSDIYLNII